MPATPTPPQFNLGRRFACLLNAAVHYSVELILIALILYLCMSRGLALRVDVHDPISTEAVGAFSLASLGNWVGRFGRPAPAEPSGDNKADPLDIYSVAPTRDPAPHISNLTLVLSPDYGERKRLAPHIIAAKRQRVQHYLNQYAPAARREMRTHGVPASITLAQGLLESNAGDSKLAVDSKNHFGIKCRAKCLGCTCRNYGDDTRYDMFRVFDSVADSYREHSMLLNSPRYAKLKQHGLDYRKWAHGLKQCGYATDKRYAQKLIAIIEHLKLDQYDAPVLP